MSWMKRISQSEDRVLVARENPFSRVWVAGVFVACAAMALPVLAQVVGDRTVFLWDGSGATERNVRLGAWGNGDFEINKDVEGRGQNVLEVRTRNFYEGVRFQFAQPLPLDSYRESGLLRFRVRSEKLSEQFNSPVSSASPGIMTPTLNPYGTPPAFNPYAPPNFNPRGNPYSPLGNPGGQPFGAPGATPSATPPSISTVQVVMHLERGALFGQFAFTESNARPEARGWQTFVVPISQMRATPDASGGLRTVVISGNREGTFDLGQLALVPNSGSNSVSIRRVTDPIGTQQTTLEVQPGPLRLVADVESGINDVVVDWNFDADKTGALPAPPTDVLPRAMPAPGSPLYTFQPVAPPGYAPPGSIPSPIQMRGERLDARGYIAQVDLPNEEQDYRVEVTLKDRDSLREIGKASVIVKVRSAD